MKALNSCLRRALLAAVLFAVMAPASAELPATGPGSAIGEGERRSDSENDPELYLQLIAGMQEKNLYFASLAHLDAFDRRWPGNARAALLRGDALRETGYFERARAVYRNLLKSDLSAGAYHGLGLIAGRQGDQAGALEALSQANRLAPTSVPILNDLGYVQLIGGQLDEARLSLHKAAELDQKNVRVGSNLALLYLLDRKPERAGSIMKWYQLPEAHRQEIYRKYQEMMKTYPALAESGTEVSAAGQKIDKVESPAPPKRE